MAYSKDTEVVKIRKGETHTTACMRILDELIKTANDMSGKQRDAYMKSSFSLICRIYANGEIKRQEIVRETLSMSKEEIAPRNSKLSEQLASAQPVSLVKCNKIHYAVVRHSKGVDYYEVEFGSGSSYSVSKCKKPNGGSVASKRLMTMCNKFIQVGTNSNKEKKKQDKQKKKKSKKAKG